MFDELGNDTVEAVQALKMLGGVDAEALDSFVPEPIEFTEVQEQKCCCWG